jgi:outer membrane receptor protein involved in Fe transport
MAPEVGLEPTHLAAAFGEVTWRATDRFNLTGGLRYTAEDKTGTFSSVVFGGGARCAHDTEARWPIGPSRFGRSAQPGVRAATTQVAATSLADRYLAMVGLIFAPGLMASVPRFTT